MSIVRNLTLAALLVAGVAAPAQAVVFATYSTANPVTNFRWTNSGNSNAVTRTTNAVFFSSPSGSTAAAVPIRFSFGAGTGLSSFVNNVTANLTITGSVARGIAATGSVDQPGAVGSFSFVSTTAISVSGGNLRPTTYAIGSNLLSVSFGGANLVGTTGQTTGTFSAATASGDTVTFSSDFLDFTDAGAASFATSLIAMVPTLGVAQNGALRTFRGRLSGNFETAVAPTATAEVPEPQSWVLLIAGFGLVGAAMRRRAAFAA